MRGSQPRQVSTLRSHLLLWCLSLGLGWMTWGSPSSTWAQSTTCLKNNLLFVLDKSGSMLQNNKWTDAKSGINSNTQTYAQQLQYGLISFSNANAVTVDAGIPSSPSAVQTALNGINPAGDTYMVPAIAAAKKEIERSILADQANSISGRPNSIVFITDGSPSDRCPIQEVNALRTLKVGSVTYDVKTYVIGFGSNVNPICLNNLATAGGTALAGSIKYYVASSTTFTAAVSKIATSSASEACNGLDDDCDGKIDNVKGTSTTLTQSCTKGQCTGQQTCTSGSWSACQPSPPATAEICNNKDDDCDGYIDNNPGNAQNDSLTRACTTGCGTGTETCISGAFRNCSVAPQTEVCDGKDNDCDGGIDNVKNTSQPLKRTCRKGRCPGNEVCQSGSYGSCVPNTAPSAETCNGQDDDCDGYIDNNLGSTSNNTLTRTCTSACGNGTETCISGAFRNCTAPTPQAESCNNKDDDCDGKIDNIKGKTDGITQTCYQGRCRGTRTCTAGSWSTCKPNTAPTAETCNNADDDCDGYLDNTANSTKNYTLTRSCQTACGAGTETCISGQWRNCTAAPNSEGCNGKDDDCDGKVDNIKGSSDPLKRACSVGRCSGEQICSNGAWDTCKPKATPTAETCNGQDDDCDGYIDNNKGLRRNNSLTRPCTSGCGTGTETCISGSWRNCTVAPKSESCNGKDDDCDGKIDNVKGTTNPLSGSCSVGRCSGTRTCTGGKWATCQPKATPAAETCNRQDDDCDGYIDNDKGVRRHNTLTRACTTGCGTGKETCISGAWRNCTVAAKPEVCNNQDDDCDGKVDNVKGTNDKLSRFCVTGGCDGFQPCSGGLWGVCQPKSTNRTETCNGRDDDCDGYIDNKAGDTKNYTLTQPCSTACGQGNETCVSGRWQNCTAPPATSELCNGKDDNCNGRVDETWSAQLGKPCSNQCGQGVIKCRADGKGAECVAPQQKPEVCDGQDNDCDGQVDEDWPQKGKLCVAGSGACQKTGLFLCKLDQSGLECSAKAPNQPSAEVCDGIDNDCDGKVDENLRRPCSSPCGKGDEVCQEGTWSSCSGGSGSGGGSAEVCDNKDNDCDGYVDNQKGTNKGNTLQRACKTACGSGNETCIRGQWQACTAPKPKAEECNGQDDDCDGQIDGNQRPCATQCGRGTETCTGGKWGACSSPQSTPEVCDGKDNNCDGQVDENLVATCKTACGEGKETCVKGKWQFCNAPQPKAEECNGLDDDCNGTVDDNIPPRACQGACGEGTATCTDGKYTGCTGGPQPTPEVCDNKDNDCDGKVDGLQRYCRTTCGEGVEVCQAGTWGGCLAPYPEKEKCDGQDNDCNGLIDENATCAQGFTCLLGACRRTCRGGECPGGQRCVNGACVSVTPCQGIQCPQGLVCKNDKCTDGCDDVKCPTDQLCRNGKCYPKNCYAYGCPLGKQCVKGACVDDPCANLECNADEFCRNGQCVGACKDGCAKGEKCVDGTCEADPCAGVSCNAGERCDKGKCIPDTCANVTCPNGERCVDGKCEHDPCHNIKCPLFTECKEGQCVGKPPEEPVTEPSAEAPGPEAVTTVDTDGGTPRVDIDDIGTADKISGGESSTQSADGATEAPGGCGCATTNASISFLGWGLLLLWAGLLLRRRRRRELV